MPQRSIFSRSAFTRVAEISLATKRPSPFNCSPNAVIFPPGAAHRSSTRSPGRTPLIAAGNIAAGS